MLLQPSDDYFLYRRSVKKLLCCVLNQVLNFCSALVSVLRNHFGKISVTLVVRLDGCLSSGPANDWYDTFHPYFNYSQTIRQWFAINVLLRHPERIPQYLLECPSTEVSLIRQIYYYYFLQGRTNLDLLLFEQSLLFLGCNTCSQQILSSYMFLSSRYGICFLNCWYICVKSLMTMDLTLLLDQKIWKRKVGKFQHLNCQHMCLTLGGTKYLSQTILEILLSLLKKEVPEHGRHLQQYFHVFLSYAMKGAREVRIVKLEHPCPLYVQTCIYFFNNFKFLFYYYRNNSYYSLVFLVALQHYVWMRVLVTQFGHLMLITRSYMLL